jgi:hypothetical protein
MQRLVALDEVPQGLHVFGEPLGLAERVDLGGELGEQLAGRRPLGAAGVGAFRELVENGDKPVGERAQFFHLGGQERRAVQVVHAIPLV